MPHRDSAPIPDLARRHPGFPHHLLKIGLSGALIYLVLIYRVTLGQLWGGHCRFHPTCSQYMMDAIGKYGPVAGAWRGLKRIARCHPLGRAGYDPA